MEVVTTVKARGKLTDEHIDQLTEGAQSIAYESDGTLTITYRATAPDVAVGAWRNGLNGAPLARLVNDGTVDLLTITHAGDPDDRVLMSSAEVAEALRVEPGRLRTLRESDPDFPRPVPTAEPGLSYDVAEVALYALTRPERRGGRRPAGWLVLLRDEAARQWHAAASGSGETLCGLPGSEMVRTAAMAPPDARDRLVKPAARSEMERSMRAKRGRVCASCRDVVQQRAA